MAFRPDREKLNAHFEGYKLGKKTLTRVSQPFRQDVRVARLHGDDFGYQHVRAFTLCNHLSVDPWDGDSVYWSSSNGSVMRGRYLKRAGDLKVEVVYQYPDRLGATSPTVNPSLVFITPHHCVLTNGSGSTVHLLHTPSRSSSPPPPPDEGEGDGGDRPWNLVEDLKLPNVTEESVSILSAHYEEKDQRLHLATMTLSTPSTSDGKRKKGEKLNSKPPIATYNWYLYHIELTPSLNPPPAAGGEEDSKDSNLDLVCSLHSSTVALYGAFLSDHLIILSEADVMPMKQPAPMKGEEERAEEEKPEDLHKLVQEAQKHNEPEKDDGGEGETKKHAGLGFDTEKAVRSSEEPKYQWTQTEGDISITIPVPDDVTKRDVHCVFDRRELVVGLSDGTTFLRGRLFAPISPNCCTWTIEKHIIEVSLEKEIEGEWASLTVAEDEGEEEEGTVSSDLPLRGLVADQLSPQEFEKLKKKVEEATKEGAKEGGKDQLSLMQGMFYEECDMNDEDATFFVTKGNTAPKKVSLAGRQFLFSSPSHPQTPPFVCLRHDVDAVLWQPQATPTSNGDSSNLSSIDWGHVGTFNALAYVQAARQDKKFTVSPPNMKFAALSDCNRHVFIYQQPEEGVKGNSAWQYVTTLKSQEDILGLQATDSGLVYVLKEHELHVIVVY